MFLIASFLVAVVTTYLYVGLRWWALERHPLPVYGLLLAAAALALLQWKVSGQLWIRLITLVPVLYAAVFVFAVAVLHDYGNARPTGPAVLAVFPAMQFTDAASDQEITVGVAEPGRYQLIVLFRGFW